MKTGRFGAVLFPLVLGLSGCAGMSAEECAVSDWRTIGFEDGSRGYDASRIGEHRKDCAEYGVTPDFDAYQAGRDEGLALFCQPSRGFNLGSNGGRYNGVCSADLEPSFLDSYRAGFQLYTLRDNVNSATSRISAKENELERTKDSIRQAEARLVDAETTTEERILLLADVKDLSERTGELETEVDLLIDERARHEERLASYQAQLATAGY